VNAAAVESMRRVWGRDIQPGDDMRAWMGGGDVAEFEAHIEAAMRGETIEFERSATMNGVAYAFEVSYCPVRMEDGAIRGVLLGSRDITERKRASDALMQTQKLESLAVLAGGIAHDFNNLLVGILGNAGLALSELSPSSPARETIEAIETAGQRAAELARQMLAYSGKGKFLIQDVELSGLVKEMTHLLRVSIGKRVSLQLHLTEDLPAVEADATQLRQVVMNLVVNASDAIGDRDGVISVTTSLLDATTEDLASSHLAPDLPAGRYVAVEVADTGVGMDADTAARIFDPFFTTKFTGRGLGLAAALGIMRGHRGAIKVISAPGEGTTFRLLLPATGFGAESRPGVLDTDQWHGSGLVLVVDDEPTVRSVTARALKAFGFEVIEAADGVEGVQQFRERADEVVAVLLDMTMPRMNGEEAFVAIKDIDPSARVILMSGFTEQDATERYSGRGLAGFVQKPYELATLREMMRETLQRD
jgi:signal transduction histidine kinase/CheY-like chemotaxis protein